MMARMKVPHYKLVQRIAVVCLMTSVIGACHSSAETPESAVKVIGLKTSLMNYHSSQQEAENWCWAACIQMALSTKGIDVLQSDIVKRAFSGRVIDRAGSREHFLANLNGELRDRLGRNWELTTSGNTGPPSFALLKEQFSHEMPVIVGYDNPGQAVGHAVVITAVVYEVVDGEVELLRVLVRDPWPTFQTRRGKRELTRDEFDRIISHYVVTPHRR